MGRLEYEIGIKANKVLMDIRVGVRFRLEEAIGFEGLWRLTQGLAYYLAKKLITFLSSS